MTWAEGPYAPFDLESTGVSVHDDRIVTAFVGRVGKDVEPAEWNWLVNSGQAIPDEAVAIHHVTTEHAFEHGIAAPIAVDQIAARVADALAEGIPIVGHNVVFDLSMLGAECRRYQVPTVAERIGRDECPVIDTLVLDKKLDRFRKGSRRLVDVDAHYRIDLSEIDAHGAAADALAAARIAWRMAVAHPQLRRLTLLELHDAQVEWAAAQAASFREYLVRQGKPADDVDGVWPVRTRVSAVLS